MTPHHIDTIAQVIAGDAWAAMDERDRHGVRQAARRQIERVGLAIACHIHRNADFGMRGEDAYRAAKADFDAQAVSAILAMPEPDQPAKERA